jgi:hypothetical protein
MIAVILMDKRNVHVLTNIRYPPPEGNFCDESGNALKPAIVEDYSQCMGLHQQLTEWRTATVSVAYMKMDKETVLSSQ